MATTYSFIAANKRRSWALIIIFVAFLGLLGWVFGQLSDAGYFGVFLALVLALGMSFVGYFSGDRVALALSGARPISKQDNPYVYRIVENLAMTAGLPTPKVYLIDDPGLNAFATGRDPKHASIAVTVGLVEKLENEELEGVVAHELSHVKNLDIRYMTLVVVMVGAVSLLSHFFLRARLFGGRGNNRDSGQIGAILLIVGLIMAILAPLFAELVKLAISRRREYLADASGALLTRYPEGLARALEKIGSENRPLQRADQTTASLFIASPFGTKKIAGLFSTHPPIQDRVRALRAMGS